MRRLSNAFTVAGLLFLAFVAYVNFFPDHARRLLSGSDDLLADGRCVHNPSQVERLWRAVVGEPAKPFRATLVAQVRDGSGGPVPGANVGLRLDGAEAPELLQTSDSEGRAGFQLATKTAPWKAQLSVSAKGFLAWSRELAQPAGQVEVTLDRGGIISGRLLDEDGAPVVGATLMSSSGIGATGPDGSFELTGHAVGEHYVQLYNQDRSEANAIRVEGVSVKVGSTGPNRVTLTGRRRGAKVRLSMTGFPRSWSLPRLYRGDGPSAEIADPAFIEGRSVGFVGLDEGTWQIEYEAPGQTPSGFPSVTRHAWVQAMRGQTVEMTLLP